MASEYQSVMHSKKCARCGENRDLHTHHLDYDHYNDAKENKILLCRNCHMSLHQGKWHIQELGIEVKEYCTKTIRTSKKQKEALKMIKELNEWEPERKFTQFELKQVPGFTGNTLRALFRKGVIDIVKDAPIDGPDYYYWTGEELE